METLFAAVDYVNAGERDADNGPRAGGSSLMLDDAVMAK